MLRRTFPPESKLISDGELDPKDQMEKSAIDDDRQKNIKMSYEELSHE